MFYFEVKNGEIDVFFYSVLEKISYNYDINNFENIYTKFNKNAKRMKQLYEYDYNEGFIDYRIIERIEKNFKNIDINFKKTYINIINSNCLSDIKYLF